MSEKTRFYFKDHFREEVLRERVTCGTWIHSEHETDSFMVLCYLQVDAVVLLLLVDLLVCTSVNSMMIRSLMQSYQTDSDCRSQNKNIHKHIKHLNNQTWLAAHRQDGEQRDSELHKHMM